MKFSKMKGMMEFSLNGIKGCSVNKRCEEMHFIGKKVMLNSCKKNSQNSETFLGRNKLLLAASGRT